MLICEAVEPDGKTCTMCAEYLPLDHYYQNKSVKSGLMAACKPCYAKRCKGHYENTKPVRLAKMAVYSLFTKYGLTQAEWDVKWNAQDGVCPVCETPINRGASDFATDHDHSTGKVRAILHKNCNAALGLLRDDPAIMRRAAAYVEQYRDA